MDTVVRIYVYLKGTMHTYGLHYRQEKFSLIGYSDSNFANCEDT